MVHPHLLESAPMWDHLTVFPVPGVKTHGLKKHPLISTQKMFDYLSIMQFTTSENNKKGTLHLYGYALQLHTSLLRKVNNSTSFISCIKNNEANPAVTKPLSAGHGPCAVIHNIALLSSGEA